MSVITGDIKLYGSDTTYSILLGRYFSPFLYFSEETLRVLSEGNSAVKYVKEFGTKRITNAGGQAVVLTDNKDYLSATILSEGGIPLPFFRKLVDLYRDLRIEYKFIHDAKIVSGSIGFGTEFGPYYYTEDGDCIMN